VNLELYNDIDAADLKAQYDMYAKQLISHKIILAHILVNTIEEFHGMQPEDVVNYIEGDVYVSQVPVDGGMTNSDSESDDKIVLPDYNTKGSKIVGLNTANAEINEGTIYFDLIFYVRMKDGLAQMIVNIEVQKDLPTTYKILNRAVFYTSRMISSQKQRDFTGQNYDDIKQVYSIWIVMGMKEDSISHIHLIQENLVGKNDLDGNLDLFNIIFICLTDEIPKKEENKEFLRLLSTLLSDKMESNNKKEILHDEFNVDINECGGKELNIMSNLGQAVYDNGVRDGVVIERSRGLEALVTSLKNFLMNPDDVYKVVIKNKTYSDVTREEVYNLYNQV
jgi:hypothetical protein